MNSLQLSFNSLNPKKKNSIEYPGISPKGYKNKLWICKNEDNFPLILIQSSVEFNFLGGQKYSNIELLHHQKKIIQDEQHSEEVLCSSILCKTEDDELNTLFFESLLPLLKKIKFPADPKELNFLLERLVKLFKSLGGTPKKTTQGLWAELFLIYQSENKKELLECWHEEANDLYDFRKGIFSIEVKSTLGVERKHIFSLEQAYPREYSVLIASFKLERDEAGLSIKTLIEDIQKDVSEDQDLIEKLNYIVWSTLGNTWSSSIKESFNEELAKKELEFYDIKDIPKLEESSLRIKGLSKISFTSNLESKSPIRRSTYKGKSRLYKEAIGYVRNTNL